MPTEPQRPRRPQQYGGGRGDITVVVDCSDLARATTFWTQVLDYAVEQEAEGLFQSLVPADGVGVEILLQRVHEAKEGKNRVHLDLRTRDMDAEVRRVVDLGATRVTAQPIVEEGWAWHVLLDPDGNEFCVLQPTPDYWEA